MRWLILLLGIPSFFGTRQAGKQFGPPQPKDCSGPKGRAVFERREAY